MKIKVGDKVIFSRKIHTYESSAELGFVGVVTTKEDGRDLCVKVDFGFKLNDDTFYEWFMEDELSVVTDELEVVNE